jgi:hypothetical protein
MHGQLNIAVLIAMTAEAEHHTESLDSQVCN